MKSLPNYVEGEWNESLGKKVPLFNSINNEGGDAKITIYDEDSHDADKAFKNKELYKWFNSLT